MITSQTIIDFWFLEIDRSLWFKKDQAFDQLLIDKFSKIHQQAQQCELFHWRDTPLGRLAEIILLDQFSRNMFRDTPEAFAYDSLSLALSQQAIDVGADASLNSDQKAFLYMPFMHSESQLIHQQAVKLFNQKGLENNHRFELAHKKIIDQFGRYPHRNAIMGRASSEEELTFLNTPGSSF